MILSSLRKLWHRARSAGFTRGYAAGIQDAPYVMPCEIVEAFWKMDKAMTTRPKASDDYLVSAVEKAQYATHLYEVLKAHIIPEGEVSHE